MLHTAYLLIVGIILVLISGVAEGIRDKLNFHYDRSVFTKLNPTFWNPFVSWKNKYKNKDVAQGETFRGKYLVFTTDAWHLFKFLERWVGYVGIVLVFIYFKNEQFLLSLVYSFIVIFGVRSLAFNLTFNRTNL